MKVAQVFEFLRTFNVQFNEEARNKISLMCQLIANKMLNPKTPECKFVTLIAEEKWERAYLSADNINKEAIDKLDLYKKFVSYVKQQPFYIEKKRDDILNDLLK